jgi:drug/metabolite transporter (DMT)-like permease
LFGRASFWKTGYIFAGSTVAPVLSAIACFVVFGEQPNAATRVAAVLFIAGIVLASRPTKT